ncbi:DMT family transporter [Amphiplicatus metriothermophilus]|uniref:Permease of the drug/metabolite transporter (DMT) superfamily n=1 Tax=Amphiplicatus metriothermophilus TaxID=1519374 RepID=A0A239Q0C5_9PROT|nr:DMT family transporter [Amphiplicatus metriothermophilus]MBB5518185.1 drug/metabolite transporter (DMT)-like permease [Amphiplicatus metriothermophilus]SNT75347.1 Permease of the drug/metabolite transporter (DMT) superfamily [Amphiplicatus metriothermophilus]
MDQRRTRMARPVAEARAFDWLLLTVLVCIGGSSFAMIRGAVETIPPAAVSAGRLWVGAALMFAVMRLAGRRFPPLLARTPKGARLHRAWAYMLAVSAIGYAMPFLIFPWAQQYVESGLAGIYMAFMPIWTLALASLFADERLTPGKLAGFALGFTGVMILLGPGALRGVFASDMIAQAGLLLATFGYAASAVIARRAPAIRPRVFAAGTALGAAIMTTPVLFFTDLELEAWSATSILCVVGLGVGPTGLAGLIIIILIKRAGAGFMALANYLVPVMAVLFGAVLFGERLAPQAFVALGVILSGVALSRRRPRRRPALAGELSPVALKAEARRAGPDQSAS